MDNDNVAVENPHAAILAALLAAPAPLNSREGDFDMPYDLGINYNFGLADIREQTRAEVLTAVERIVSAYVAGGWTFNECLVAYYRYIRYSGNFTAVQNCDDLRHRTVEEVREKIRRDHNFCVVNLRTTPWGQLNSILNIDTVERSGNPNSMLWGVGTPLVDIDAPDESGYDSDYQDEAFFFAQTVDEIVATGVSYESALFAVFMMETLLHL